MAYVFEGAWGLVLGGTTALSTVAWSLPAAVLMARALGASVPQADVALAAIGLGLIVVARVVIAVFLGYPLWPALTHPFMAVVWIGILLRSLAWRFLRREMRWRGRTYPAASARF